MQGWIVEIRGPGRKARHSSLQQSSPAPPGAFQGAYRQETGSWVLTQVSSHQEVPDKPLEGDKESPKLLLLEF